MATIGNIQRKLKENSKAMAKLQRKVGRKPNNKKRNKKKYNKNRKVRRPVQYNSAPNYSPEIREWLNTMFSPFTSDCGARIPDHYSGYTVRMKDWNSMSSVAIYGSTDALGGDAATNTMPANVYQVCYFLVPGFSDINTYYNTNSNIFNTDVNAQWYHLAASFVSPAGLLSPSTPDDDYAYNSFDSANVSSIIEDYSSAWRIVSAAFKIWPVVTQVTDSSTQYIAYIKASTMTMSDFFTRFYTSGDKQSITSGILQQHGFKEYDATQGVTARFNPIQDNGANYYNMKTINTWNAANNLLDAMRIPVVLITFSQPLTFTSTGGDNTTCYATVPAYVETIYWIEAALQDPTPLMTEKSPIDLGYSQVVNTVLASNVFPEIVAGHSFKTFASKISQFTRAAASLIGNASHFGSRVSKGLTHFSDALE